MYFITAFDDNFNSLNDNFGSNRVNGGGAMCNPTKCQMPSSTAVCKEYIRTCVEYVGECCKACVQDPLLLAGLSSLITSIVFWTVVRLHYQKAYYDGIPDGKKGIHKKKLGFFSRFFITGKEVYEEEEKSDEIENDFIGGKGEEEEKKSTLSDNVCAIIKSSPEGRSTLQEKGEKKSHLDREEKDLALIRKRKEIYLLVRFIIPVKVVMYLVCLIISFITIISKPFYANKMTLNDIFVQRSVSSCLFSSESNNITSTKGSSLSNAKDGENLFSLSYLTFILTFVKSLFMSFFSDYYIISLTAGISSYVIGTTWLISDQVISLITYAYSKLKSLKVNNNDIDDNNKKSGENVNRNIFCTSLPLRRCLFAKILITCGLIMIRFSGSLDFLFSSGKKDTVYVNDNHDKDNTVLPLSPGYVTLLFSTFVLIVISMI